MRFVWASCLLAWGFAVCGASLCSPEEVEFSRHCYYFKSDSGLPYPAANDFCRNRNSFLVKIDNLEENQWILKQDQSRFGRWIGLQRVDPFESRQAEISETGNYRWTMDKSVAHWDNFNQNKMHGGYQYCIYMDLDGSWADQDCKQPYNVICERDPFLGSLSAINDTVKNFSSQLAPLVQNSKAMLHLLLTRLRVSEQELADNKILLTLAIERVQNITDKAEKRLQKEDEIEKKLELAVDGMKRHVDKAAMGIKDGVEAQSGLTRKRVEGVNGEVQEVMKIVGGMSRNETVEFGELKRHLAENSNQLNKLAQLLNAAPAGHDLRTMSDTFNKLLHDLNEFVGNKHAQALPEALRLADSNPAPEPKTSLSTLEILLLAAIIAQIAFITGITILALKAKRSLDQLNHPVQEDIYSEPNYHEMPQRRSNFLGMRFNVASDRAALVQRTGGESNPALVQDVVRN